MPLDELLAVTRESAAYNEGDRRSLFYAQSWALVHMLMSGADNRSADVNEYVRLVETGTPSGEAWKAVFGEEKIIAALGRYVNEDVMRGTTLPFRPRHPPRDERTSGRSATRTSPRCSPICCAASRLTPKRPPDSRKRSR